VGEYTHELKAYQCHFNVLPCKYPTKQEWALNSVGPLAPEGGASGGSGGSSTGVEAVSKALHASGLGQYAPLFATELMDVESLAALGQSDAAELGVQTQDLPALGALVKQARSGSLSQVAPGTSLSSSSPEEPSSREDCRALAPLVFSVDGASTRDVDDALSFEFDRKNTDDGTTTTSTVRLGVHIADVASRVPCSSPLFAWARARASSCYHGGVASEGVEGGSVPMLPPELAHGELSLNEVRVGKDLTELRASIFVPLLVMPSGALPLHQLKFLALHVTTY